MLKAFVNKIIELSTPVTLELDAIANVAAWLKERHPDIPIIA